MSFLKKKHIGGNISVNQFVSSSKKLTLACSVSCIFSSLSPVMFNKPGSGLPSAETEKHSLYHPEIRRLNPAEATAIHGWEELLAVLSGWERWGTLYRSYGHSDTSQSCEIMQKGWITFFSKYVTPPHDKVQGAIQNDSIFQLHVSSEEVHEDRLGEKCRKKKILFPLSQFNHLL